MIEARRRGPIRHAAAGHVGRAFQHDGRILLAALTFSLLFNEWCFSYPEHPFSALAGGYRGRVLGVVVLVVGLYCSRHRFHTAAERSFEAWFRLAAGWMAIVFVCERINDSPYNVTVDPATYFQFFQIPVWLWVGFHLTARPEEAKWLLSRLALLTAGLSAAAYLSPRVPGVTRLVTPGSWPMEFACLFGFAWYLVRYLVEAERRWASLAGLAAACLFLLLPMHKTAVWAVGFAMVPAALFACLGRRARLRHVMLLAALITAAVGAFHWADVQEKGTLAKRVRAHVYRRYLHRSSGRLTGDFQKDLDAAAGGRFEIWEDAWPRFLASPMVGSGLGQTVEPDSPVHMHNGYVDLLLSYGLCGFLPVALFFLWWYRLAVAHVRTPGLTVIYLACLCYVTGILACNVGDVTRWFSSVGIMVGLTTGMTLRLALEMAPARSRRKRGRTDISHLHRPQHHLLSPER